MSTGILQRAIELFLCWTFIGSSAMLLQSPGFNGGKLVIQSTPHTGANIYINRKATNRQTDSSFVVSSGTYWVAVTGGPDNLNCGGDGGKAQIIAGSIVTLICGPKGWQ